MTPLHGGVTKRIKRKYDKISFRWFCISVAIYFTFTYLLVTHHGDVVHCLLSRRKGRYYLWLVMVALTGSLLSLSSQAALTWMTLQAQTEQEHVGWVLFITYLLAA